MLLHKIAPKNFVAKNATVKPSKVAGTALSNTAGLPICSIWDKLIPSPPIYLLVKVI